MPRTAMTERLHRILPLVGLSVLALVLVLPELSSAQSSAAATGDGDDASAYFGLRLSAGETFGNVFSKTVSHQGGGIDDDAHTIGGTERYEVVDPSPDRPSFRGSSRYDGRPGHVSLVEIRDTGQTTCSVTTGKCHAYLDDSGPVFDAFLWGKPSGKLAVGESWTVKLAVPWELGPAGTEIVTVLRVDPASHEVALKREGSGDGFFADEDKTLTLKKAGKDFTVDVVPGAAHWVGYTVFREGLTVSDELLETRSLTVSSDAFGQAVVSERQFTLLDQSPADLI